MTKFEDKLGREWTLEITMASADQVEQDVKIDLLKWVADPAGAADNRTVFKIVGSLVADQIAGRDLTLREFAAGFDGPALERAGEALMESLLFFSQPQRVARAMLPKMRQVATEIQDRMVAAIEAQDSSRSAGDSPACADSTPAR